MIKLLRPKASKYGISRDEVQQRLQKEHLEDPECKQEKMALFLQYRQFIVEYTFIRDIFKCFNYKEITKFINEKKSQGHTYSPEIVNIINVLIILKKIDDYA